MNQAIKILDEMILTILSKAEEHKESGRLDLANNNIDEINILKELKKRISSLPSDTQWIDQLEKELEEEDKDIDSLDDYYMGLSVGKTIMLNRVKREILPTNN